MLGQMKRIPSQDQVAHSLSDGRDPLHVDLNVLLMPSFHPIKIRLVLTFVLVMPMVVMFLQKQHDSFHIGWTCWRVPSVLYELGITNVLIYIICLKISLLSYEIAYSLHQR